VTGQALAFPARGDKVVALLASLKTKGQTGSTTLHFPTVIHALSGIVTVEMAGKAPRAVRTGEAIVAPMGAAFNLTNKGTVPTRFVIVSFTEDGQPWMSGAGVPRDFKADTVLETTTTWAGEPILFPAGANQIAVLSTSVPAGAVIAKHTHAHTQFVFMLQGEHTVEPTGHPKHSFAAGSAMIETTQPHVGTNAGHEADRFVTVFVGKSGVPLSTPVH
jgi:quercetin dioxygenase-like cupin family protein